MQRRSNRASRYEGKIPDHRHRGPDDAEQSLGALNAALEAAIQSEHFEEAASIRDRIKAAGSRSS